MKLFCKHEFISILQVNIPDIPGHLGKTEHTIMCVKCGKHRTVNAYGWLIIRERQRIRENNKTN